MISETFSKVGRISRVCAVAAVSFGCVDLAQAAPVQLASHHMVYDLTLESVTDGSTVAASGTMTFDVSDVCTAWSTHQQLKLQTSTREGASSQMVSNYATLESKDGHHLVFQTTQSTDGRDVQTVKGEADTSATSEGVVHYTSPSVATLKLPQGTLFPMAHTTAILQAAEDGKKSLSPYLFDGTGPDGALYTYVMILDWLDHVPDAPTPSMNAIGAGRMHVAFFSTKTNEMTPEFETSLRYFSNGVSDQIHLDFGDFKMKGQIRDFHLTAAPKHC